MNYFWQLREPPSNIICCTLKQKEINNPSLTDLDSSAKWEEYFKLPVLEEVEISHSILLSFLTHAKPSLEYYKYIQAIISKEGVRETLLSHGILSILKFELKQMDEVLFMDEVHFEIIHILIDPNREFEAYLTTFSIVDRQLQTLDKSFIDAVTTSLLLHPLDSHIILNILGSISISHPIPTHSILDLIGRDIDIEIQIKALLIILLADNDSLHLQLNLFAMVSSFCDDFKLAGIS
jgi:hypothetical protein